MRWDAEKYDEVKAPQIEAGRELIALAKVKETDAVLDIGCGTGKLTAELASLASSGKVIGIDPSQEMLDKARKISSGINNMHIMQIAAQSMSFDGDFDLAFSNSALQWIKEQQEIIGLIYNSLKRGGRIAFQLPAKNFCGEFFDYTENAIVLLGYKGFFVDWKMPWYFPTTEKYEKILRDTGFNNIKVFYRDYRILFDSINEVLCWWTPGITPYLELLPEKEQEYFKYAFSMKFENNRTKKGIELNFRRLFAFAEK